MRHSLPFAFLLSVLTFSSLSLHAQEYDEEGNREDKQAGRLQWFLDRWSGGDTAKAAQVHTVGYASWRQMADPLAAGRAFKGQSIAAWQRVGGAQEGRVSGRAMGLGFHPTNTNIIYLGTAQGGLWKTTDHGANWVNVSESWPISAMGAVAVDPVNPQIVYAGTGDPNGFDGDGIYKSTDGGLNWSQIATANDVTGKSCLILIDPTAPERIYHAGLGQVSRSTDGGATWKSVARPGGKTWLAMDPTDPKTIYATGDGAVYKTTDGGDTWPKLTPGLTMGTNQVIGIAPKDPKKVYISSSYDRGRVIRSTDAGATWKNMSTTVQYLGEQGWYANALSVSPVNADFVQVGGLDIYTGPSNALTRATNWTVNSASANFTHADIHRLFYGPDGVLWALTDGGVYSSIDRGGKWSQSANATLSTLQFVGFDASPDLKYFIGGCQDNGVNRANAGEPFFEETAGGDGGWTRVAQDGSDAVYSTYIYANLHKSVDQGRSWQQGDRGDNNIICNETLLNEGAPFYMNYDVFEKDAASVVLAANQRVWITTDGGGDCFNPITKLGQVSGGPAVVKFSPANNSTIYVGGRNRSVYVTTDLGETWVKSTKTLGGSTPTGFAIDPTDETRAWAVVSGLTTNHVYMTTDRGLTWVGVDENMPNVSCNAIARAPNGNLFVGHDFGVVYSADNGKTWVPLKNGLPISAVMSLHVRGNGGSHLVAGTYGRGGFVLDIADLPTVPANAVTGDGHEGGAATAGALQLGTIAPNPVHGGAAISIGFSLEKEGDVEINLLDVLGREVRKLDVAHYAPGPHSVSAPTSGLAAGHYLVTVTALGRTEIRSLIVQ